MSAAPDVPDPSVITFIMVGCERCGTTWVDAALREHPQVFLPAQKQSYYFDRHHDEGPDWYLERFRGAGPEHRAVGEVATGYCLPEAVPRLAALLPHARLLMAMRHPVERAYSYFVSRQAERGWASFEAALADEPSLRERGHYADQVEDLRRHYPADRMLLLLYDDLDADDRAFLRRIHAFIGVDPDVATSLIGQRKNAAMLPGVRRVLHRVGLKPALVAASRSRIGNVVRRGHKRLGRAGYAPMDPGTRARLLEHFEPHNARLAAILGRDLSHWDA